MTEPDLSPASVQLDAVRRILRAISDSPFDQDGVLRIVVAAMCKLCHADQASIFVPSRPGFVRGVATVGMSPEGSAYELEHETPLTNGTILGRALAAGGPVQIEDAAADPTYTWGGRQLLGLDVRLRDHRAAELLQSVDTDLLELVRDQHLHARALRRVP